MTKGEETKQRLIDHATTLFEQQGYAATGINQILKAAQAPKGSFYFHFKEGKEALAAEVVEQHGQVFLALLQGVFSATTTPQDAIAMMVAQLADHFEASGCVAGCPVTAIATEMASTSDVLQRATRDVFELWTRAIAQGIAPAGEDVEVYLPRARALVSTTKGALVLCRAYGNAQPLRELLVILPEMIRSQT